MSQCSRCNKPCAPTDVLCDECRLQEQGQFKLGRLLAAFQSQGLPGESGTGPQVALVSERSKVYADPSTRITGPSPIIQPPVSIPHVNSTEQVIDRLSEAAQRIAEEERSESTLHKRPHASRLAPLRDISGDIRRESTPLNSIAKTANPVPSTDLPAVPASGQFPGFADTPELPESEQREEQSQDDLGKHMPDLWPWLLEPDAEENDTDNWANRTDPLTLRHFPSSDEAARIEEEDIRRALAEGTVTASLPTRRTRSSRLRLIFLVLTVLAMLALVVDGILLTAALLHPPRTPNDANGPASLTVAPNAAKIGDKVTARISHFAPSTWVVLTHDIEEQVQTTTGSSPIKLDTDGNASVSLLIDDSWGPGFHTLEAEDVTTRYTASASLQIVGAGETRPSHLLLDTSVLDMGADFQGANTIKMLTLHNSGDGSPISWAASSNRSWLMLSPPQGIFSKSQALAVAVDRANLNPGSYSGTITISSNVDVPHAIQVQMSVRPLPANAGPVLGVMPAVLSFTAIDGGANPAAQSLTLSNPGTQPVKWSLADSTSAITASQSSLFRALGTKANWLSTNVTAGAILPKAAQQVQVSVNSRNLLPGTYSGTLTFTPSAGPYDKVQSVNVTLTVQPHCGLSTSSGSLSFTSVAGQSNPSNQPLTLSATVSCTSPISWTAMSSASWLAVTPSNGKLNGAASAVTSVAVNASVLAAGSYSGVLSFFTGQSSQSVSVQLTVQTPSSPVAPIIAVSSLTLNFSTTQGQQSPASQVVTLTNSGRSPLSWSTSVAQLATAWLGVSPSGGSIPAGQSAQLAVNVNTAPLTPGTYVGQITLSGKDAQGHPAGGSPQTMTVNVLVLPPCVLVQPSSSALVFSATQGGADPAPQQVQMTASGNCGWPLSWHASVSAGVSWLTLTPAAGTLGASGQAVSLSVAPSMSGLQAAPAPYTAQVTLSATDSAGVPAQGSPQVFSVSLNVLQPCQLAVSPSSLAFTAPDTSAQTVSLSETGSCARPVSWSAKGDAGSSSWLVLSPTSGSDPGTNSTLNVSTTAGNLAPGTYTGYITVSASDAGGTAVQGSGQTVSVTLTVPGFSVSGTVIACSDSTCATPVPLAGATVTVYDSLNNQVATTTADSSGNYSLPPLAAGTYTVSASGTDGNGVHYTGTATLVVTTVNQTNFAIKVF